MRLECLSKIALFILLLSFSAYLIQPIWDSDFWWHIASGQWIWQHLALPEDDPFGVFSKEDQVRFNNVLYGQWFGQVLIYWIHTLLGEYGILAFRAGIILFCLYLVYLRSRLLGADTSVALFYVIFAGLLSLGFTGTRPQLFTFLFLAVSFLLLDLYQLKKDRRYLYPLPIIGLLWVNTHGGFLIGVALIGLLSAGVFIEAAVRNKSNVWRNKYANFLIIIYVLFLLATLITPNGIWAYLYLFNMEGSTLQKSTSEYYASYKIYQLGYTVAQAWIYVLLLAHLLGIVGLYKQKKTESLLLIFLVLISIFYYRYFPLMLFAAGPYACVGISYLLRRFPLAWEPLLQRLRKIATSLVALASLGFVILGSQKGWTWNTGVKPGYFPVHTVEYINHNALQGRIFNWLRWGGYLIWSSPQMTPAIDGRMLNQHILEPYKHILWATVDGIRFFNQADFDYVLLPRYARFQQEEYQLHKYLATRQDWQLIVEDLDNGVLLYRHLR